MLKKVWSDPVWSKVIAAVIIGTGAGVGTYLFAWPQILSFVKRGYAYSYATTSVKNWILGGLIILSFSFVITLGAMTFLKFARGSRGYTVDSFFGLRWRWQYKGESQPYKLTTFCPHCDFQVFPQDPSASRPSERLFFICENCGEWLAEMTEPLDALESKVTRSIQQKLRTDTWRR